MYTLYFNHVSHIMNYDIPERYSIREWMFFDRYGIWSGALYLPFANDANIDDIKVLIIIR